MSDKPMSSFHVGDTVTALPYCGRPEIDGLKILSIFQIDPTAGETWDSYVCITAENQDITLCAAEQHFRIKT